MESVMSELRVIRAEENLPAGPRAQKSEAKRIKIGEVASHFDVSVDLLRLYEREGLLIPLKSAKGTRYFTEDDYPWITMLMCLVRDQGLNFAGIRRLLALLPCWDLRGCQGHSRRECSNLEGVINPCWMAASCCNPQDCYHCPVYRAAAQCGNLKTLLANGAQ
jgi:MerR family transcriptional regulator/heat shock protein HspR